MIDNSVRNQEILLKRQQGQLFETIAKEYGLSSTRIRQIYYKAAAWQRVDFIKAERSENNNKLQSLPIFLNIDSAQSIMRVEGIN
jgi:hypothetical protein